MEHSGKTRTLESIARSAQAPVDTVASLYEREIEALSREARITNFIPLLAASRVRYQLRLVKGPVTAT